MLPVFFPDDKQYKTCAFKEFLGGCQTTRERALKPLSLCVGVDVNRGSEPLRNIADLTGP